MSETAEGAFEFSVGAVWDSHIFGPDGELGAKATLYRRMNARISVQKESSRFAKAKLSRLKGLSQRSTLGQTHDWDTFDGIFLLSSLSSQLQIIPSRFQISNELAHVNDVGYRSDLEYAGAQIAYEQAVRGRFALSEELARQGLGVTKLFTRTSKIKSGRVAHRLKVAFLFSKKPVGQEILCGSAGDAARRKVSNIPIFAHRFERVEDALGSLREATL